MKKWHKPKENKPPQGLKVLCMHKGDLYVAQRLGEYYFSIPFADSKFSRYFAPDLWQEIDFPGNLKGKLLIVVEDELMDMDTLEKKHNRIFTEMINGLLEAFKKGMKDDEILPKM